MSEQKSNVLLISIVGRDRVGLVSSVTGYLFEIGANLADAAYAVLGQGFEFTCVADFTTALSLDEVEEGLKGLPDMGETRITVSSFPFRLMRDDTGSITHIVEFSGGDQPGLVSRISDVLGEYGANIVRMNSRRLEGQDGYDYRTRFAINADAETIHGRFEQLESALSNIAGSLRLKCRFEAAER